MKKEDLGVFKDWEPHDPDDETYYVFFFVFCLGMIGLALSFVYL